MDATYRVNLREVNELNFARFDAKLEQRIAELRAELREEIQLVRSDLHGEIQSLRGDLRQEIHGVKAELIKWMFLFWAGSALASLLRR